MNARRTRPRSAPRALRWLLPAVPLALLGAVEIGLRLAGRPHGTYDGYFRLMAAEQTLGGGRFVYLHDADQEVQLSLFEGHQYTVRTNGLGLRGPPAERQPEPGTFRIVCVGDSATYGLYVSDPYPFPEQIGQLYHAAGRDVEVLNVAEPGAGIERELEMLEQVALQLRPSLILLTFVTNDVYEITTEAHRERDGATRLREAANRLGFLRALATRTAVGEAVFNLSVRWRSTATRRREERRAREAAPDSTSVEETGVAGGGDFQANSAKFLERFAAWDGLVLREPFDAEVEELLERYLGRLGEFATVCRLAGVPLALAYHPAYPQLYAESPPGEVRRRLADACDRAGIPFLDPTGCLRAAAEGEVLHYAPVDFHLNRRGHRALARCLVEELDRLGLVPLVSSP